MHAGDSRQGTMTTNACVLCLLSTRRQYLKLLRNILRTNVSSISALFTYMGICVTVPFVVFRPCVIPDRGGAIVHHLNHERSERLFQYDFSAAQDRKVQYGSNYIASSALVITGMVRQWNREFLDYTNATSRQNTADNWLDSFLLQNWFHSLWAVRHANCRLNVNRPVPAHSEGRVRWVFSQ